MTTLNTIIEEEKKDYAVIKHIAELADKHCPDLGTNHQATPAIDVINRFLTTAIQRAYEAGREERDTYWKEKVRNEVEGMRKAGEEQWTWQRHYNEAVNDILQALDNLK